MLSRSIREEFILRTFFIGSCRAGKYQLQGTSEPPRVTQPCQPPGFNSSFLGFNHYYYTGHTRTIFQKFRFYDYSILLEIVSYLFTPDQQAFILCNTLCLRLVTKYWAEFPWTWIDRNGYRLQNLPSFDIVHRRYRPYFIDKYIFHSFEEWDEIDSDF